MKSNTRIGIGSPLLRDFIRHQSGLRARPLGGAAMRGKVAGMFVDNEIMVTRRDHATLDYLVNELGGEIIESAPLPQRPRELECLPLRDISGMPQWVRVRIKGDDVPQDALRLLAGRDEFSGLELSSNSAAGTLAASLLLQERGLRGRLNHAGMPHGFPLLLADEGGGDGNPFGWPEYNGKSGITRAWQLCQALDNVRSLQNPIFIGVLDQGFTNLTTDYSTAPQYNVANEGASALGASSKGYAWHGNAVAGIAGAIVNNKMGAGGVAGITVGPTNLPVAMPFLFRTDITDEQIIRCLQCCVWWGIHVLNMSIGITLSGIFSSIDGDWEDTFQWATEQGLITVASAGNHGVNLPGDLRVYPATRTPGVITVGALDGSHNAARNDSNHGSSVDIWAPGTSIHTVPDPTSGGARVFFEKTSAAAPIISGVAALMKAANPALRPGDIKHILRETAWTDSPNARSNRMLNAYEAVLRAINFALPAGISEEPNDNPGTARPMQTPAANVFQPAGETVISRSGDVDYHRFTTVEYGDVVITLNTVDALSFVSMEVIPEFEALALENFVNSRIANGQTISFTNAPPGNYVVKVRGNGPNYYKLRVNFAPRPLPADIFENNQTRESAAHIRLRNRTEFDLFGLRQFYQGAYSANIQNPADVDWYSITDIKKLILTFPCCQISQADAPLDVAVFNADGVQLNSWAQVKRLDIRLPETACYVRVTCARANRYAIAFFYQLDKSLLPEPNQLPDLAIIPEWWPDPPFELREWEKWLEVVIDENLSRHGVLELESDTPLEWDLLSPDRSVLQSGTKSNGVSETVNVKDLAPGKYLMRVGRSDRAAARFQPANRASVKFSIGPGF